MSSIALVIMIPAMFLVRPRSTSRNPGKRRGEGHHGQDPAFLRLFFFRNCDAGSVFCGFGAFPLFDLEQFPRS